MIVKNFDKRINEDIINKIAQDFDEKIVTKDFDKEINDEINMFVKIEKGCDEAIKINFLI